MQCFVDKSLEDTTNRFLICKEEFLNFSVRRVKRSITVSFDCGLMMDCISGNFIGLNIKISLPCSLRYAVDCIEQKFSNQWFFFHFYYLELNDNYGAQRALKEDMFLVGLMNSFITSTHKNAVTQAWIKTLSWTRAIRQLPWLILSLVRW